MNIQQIQQFYKDAMLLRKRVDEATQQYSGFLKAVAMENFYPNEQCFKSAFDYESIVLSSEDIQVGNHGIIEYMVFEKIDELLGSLQECQLG
jgi:hypothetical protein